MTAKMICPRCGQEGNHWTDGVENYGYSCDGYALDRPPTNQYEGSSELPAFRGWLPEGFPDYMRYLNFADEPLPYPHLESYAEIVPPMVAAARVALEAQSSFASEWSDVALADVVCAALEVLWGIAGTT